MNRALQINESSCLPQLEEMSVSFEFLEIRKGDQVKLKMFTNTTLVFVMSGFLVISYNEFINRVVKDHEIILLPPGCTLDRIAKEDCKLLYCTFYKKVDFCNRFSLESLTEYCKGYKYDFHSLRMAEIIYRHLDLLLLSLNDGISCVVQHGRNAVNPPCK